MHKVSTISNDRYDRYKVTIFVQADFLNPLTLKRLKQKSLLKKKWKVSAQLLNISRTRFARWSIYQSYISIIAYSVLDLFQVYHHVEACGWPRIRFNSCPKVSFVG